MASFRIGKVTGIVEHSDALVTVQVETDAGIIDAAGWPAMLGDVAPGDRVVVNTTGLDLGLGTSGGGFLLWNLDGDGPAGPGPGHIIKMRYTPWQTEVLAVEAPESPHHDALREVTSIGGMPVVVCGLHSQIAGVAAGVKAERPEARVGYLMTDGAALPLAWSRLVRSLRESGLLDVTCTAGHAFGGELEAVNVYSGLAALRVAAGCDVVVAAMGPGVVGTSTTLGFTALETGGLVDAVTALEGRPVACLRICFADPRDRHRGLSHHTVTALTIAAHTRAIAVTPLLVGAHGALLEREIDASGLAEKHDLVGADGGPGLELLKARGVPVSSMGRSVSEIPELFLAAAAAGRVAAGLI